MILVPSINISDIKLFMSAKLSNIAVNKLVCHLKNLHIICAGLPCYPYSSLHISLKIVVPIQSWKYNPCYFIHIINLDLGFKQTNQSYLVITEEGPNLLLLIGPVEASRIPAYYIIHW